MNGKHKIKDLINKFGLYTLDDRVRYCGGFFVEESDVCLTCSSTKKFVYGKRVDGELIIKRECIFCLSSNPLKSNVERM